MVLNENGWRYIHLPRWLMTALAWAMLIVLASMLLLSIALITAEFILSTPIR